jgi:hypothetical protein
VGWMPPDAKVSPRERTGGQDGGERVGSSIRRPLSLAEAIGALFALSDERDTWMRRLGDEYRLGWKIGYATGVEEGRRREAAERDRAWNLIARPVSRGGVTHAETERRRWGPGGRLRFGDPRPGDYPGRGAA